MCGRFALHATEAEIVSHFHLTLGFSMRPRYNLAPTQTIPVICEWGKVEFCRWGFIPAWAKSDEDKIPLGHINARQETLQEKPTFKTAFKKNRCLIPASGYFEWRNFSGKKQPFYVFLKTQPLMAFAGIWSTWRSPQGAEITSTAIITTAARGVLQKLHERMPVIIPPEKYHLWLRRENTETELGDLQFEIHPVSPRMGNPRVEGIECIQPL